MYFIQLTDIRDFPTIVDADSIIYAYVKSIYKEGHKAIKTIKKSPNTINVLSSSGFFISANHEELFSPFSIKNVKPILTKTPIIQYRIIKSINQETLSNILREGLQLYFDNKANRECKRSGMEVWRE